MSNFKDFSQDSSKSKQNSRSEQPFEFSCVQEDSSNILVVPLCHMYCVRFVLSIFITLCS